MVAMMMTTTHSGSHNQSNHSILVKNKIFKTNLYSFFLINREGVMAGPGYWPSAWPVECGGPRRQKLCPTPGPNICPGERLVTTSRHTGGWAVMCVQRDVGELFLQVGAQMVIRGIPPDRERLEAILPLTRFTVALLYPGAWGSAAC